VTRGPAEIAAPPLHKVMMNNEIDKLPRCALCGDGENGTYACRTCGIRACGCCVGCCDGCHELVCAECADPGSAFDPGCPRCTNSATPDDASAAIL
jgi:hypothetical protein